MINHVCPIVPLVFLVNVELHVDLGIVQLSEVLDDDRQHGEVELVSDRGSGFAVVGRGEGDDEEDHRPTVLDHIQPLDLRVCADVAAHQALAGEYFCQLG